MPKMSKCLLLVSVYNNTIPVGPSMTPSPTNFGSVDIDETFPMEKQTTEFRTPLHCTAGCLLTGSELRFPSCKQKAIINLVCTVKLRPYPSIRCFAHSLSFSGKDVFEASPSRLGCPRGLEQRRDLSATTEQAKCRPQAFHGRAVLYSSTHDGSI